MGETVQYNYEQSIGITNAKKWKKKYVYGKRRFQL